MDLDESLSQRASEDTRRSNEMNRIVIPDYDLPVRISNDTNTKQDLSFKRPDDHSLPVRTSIAELLQKNNYPISERLDIKNTITDAKLSDDSRDDARNEPLARRKPITDILSNPFNLQFTKSTQLHDTIDENGSMRFNKKPTKNLSFKTPIVDSNLSDAKVLALLNEWRLYSEEQAFMYEKSFEFYRNINLSIAIPAIALSTIAGTGTISVATAQNCDIGNSQSTLSIIFGSLGLVSSTLFSIHRYLNLPEYQQQYRFYSDEYDKLGKQISLHVIIKNDECRTYTCLVEFAKECKKQMDVLLDKAPSIPKHIIKRASFKKGFTGISGVSIN